MVKKPPVRVVLDTNILISAAIFRGNPATILNLIFQKEIKAVTTLPLIAELSRVLTQKFRWTDNELNFLQNNISRHFSRVYPSIQVAVLKDEPDNRILEAAHEGKCDFIITGDKKLLSLKSYKNIKILTPQSFLES